MSKIQTKINFVEKKKTSARLQETFKAKQNQIENKAVSLSISPCKVKNSPSKSFMRNDKFSDKENNENITNVVGKMNPVVVLHRSPTKPVRFEVQKETEEKYKLRSSPLKRCSFSPRKNSSQDAQWEREVRCSTAQRCKCSCHQPQLTYQSNGTIRCTLLDPSPCSQESSPPKKERSQADTPSQLITKLFLESPEKQQKENSRKELFPKGEFDEACKALHSAAPTRLPGREDKLEYIKDYLLEHARDESAGTLYISGPPGTGKTASVNVALSEPEIADAYQIICLNCTSMNSTKSIYRRIVSELKLKVLGTSEKAAVSAIERHLDSSRRKMMLVVLDELDQLCTSKQSVLYSVFEWPARHNARLVLVGIANALDLTDRVLPRLQAHLSLQPTVLHFPSYTREQIIGIIADRLKQAGVDDVFSRPTLQLLAGKVAAVNGDVRRALDIARRVVELAERRNVLQPITNNVPSKQTVGLAEVLTVVNNVYSTTQTLDSEQNSNFPLQQKFLVCSLLLLRQTSKVKDITIGKLHEVYKRVCERRNLSALDISEFISLTSLVEARGILRVTGKTHNRLSKVVLQWDEAEVKSALQDKQLLAAVLMDKSVAA